VHPGPDLILFNGKIITVDKAFSIKEAVAIQSDKIIFAGNLSDLKKNYLPASKEIDLKGLTVIPGIIDSHIHMMAIGLERMKVSLADTQSISDVLDIIENECKKVGPGVWVVTNQIGFTPGQLKEQRLPDRWEIDRVSPENPVIVSRGAHFSVVNSVALRMAGIGRDTVPDEGGIIMKDSETREPTGWLGDTTLQKVRKLMPPISHKNRVSALKNAMSELNELGITSIIEPSGDRDDPGLRAYRELWEKGDLTVRTRMVVGAPFQPIPVDDIEKGPFEASGKRGLGNDGDDMLRLWGVKLMVDGGIETAFMRDPYKIVPKEQDDPTYKGLLMMSEEQIKEICLKAADKGWRLGIHVAGDAAMDAVLEAFESADRKFSIKDKRWSIMHGFLPRPEHFEIMRRLGITVACQHSHSYTKGDVMVKWWGYERASYANPVKAYMREGIVVGGGSDGKSCEWRTNILFWIDLTRQTRFAGVLGPELVLTREEMLRYHTINAAYVLGEEENLGSIEVGKKADLVVLSNDVTECSIDDLLNMQALMTIVNGRIVYQNESNDIHLD
jgi:predicted amidohydrolase YtcJ